LFVSVLFIVYSLCFATSELTIHKEIGIKSISFMSGLYFSSQAYLFFILKNFMDSGVDTYSLSKNIALGRVWTFDQKMAYLKSITDISSLTSSEISKLIFESDSLFLIKKNLNMLLEEKTHVLEPVVSINNQINNNYQVLTISLVVLSLAAVAAIVYYYYNSTASGPTVNASNLNEVSDDVVPPNAFHGIKSTGVAIQGDKIDYPWDSTGIVKEKMKIYYGFDSQRVIPDPNITLSQHEDLIPIRPFNLGLDRTDCGLISKTFTNFCKYLNIKDPTMVDRVFSDDINNNTITAPLNFFIQAIPLDVISFSQKIVIFNEWLAIHGLEINLAFGAVFFLGYMNYLNNEQPISLSNNNNQQTVVDLASLDYNFINDHGVLRFLNVLSVNMESEDDDTFFDEVLRNFIDPFAIDTLYLHFRDTRDALEIVIAEEMDQFKDYNPDLFFMGIYKFYSFLYTQIKYFSDIAQKNLDNPEVVEAYAKLIECLEHFAPPALEIFNDSNFHLFG